MVDRSLLRAALGSFATGITIVAARGRDGGLVGMTANSFNAVSLDPPLVLFSVGLHLGCHDGLSGADAYSINVLRAEQRHLSQRFGRQADDKWRDVEVITGHSGVPLIAGALAHFECRPFARHPGGDHTIFVGEVVRCWTDATGDPLLYYRSAYRALGSAAPVANRQ